MIGESRQNEADPVSRRNALRSKRHRWNETDVETVRMVGRMMEAQPEQVKKLNVRIENSLDVNRFKHWQDPRIVEREKMIGILRDEIDDLVAQRDEGR